MRPYALAVAGLGILVSAYHNVIETNPDLSSGGCDPSNPCTIRWVEGLGFWTIPRMAAACFVAILVLLALARTGPGEEPHPDAAAGGRGADADAATPPSPQEVPA